MRPSRFVRLALGVMAVILSLGSGAAWAGSVVADFDGDGVDDLVRVAPQSARVITVQSSATHRLIQLRLSGSIRALAAADVDHDGSLDLVARTGTHRLRVWLNNGHGAFHESRAAKPPKHRFTALPSFGTLKGSAANRDASDVSAGGVALPSRSAWLDAVPDGAHTSLADAALAVHARALERFGPRPPPSI